LKIYKKDGGTGADFELKEVKEERGGGGARSKVRPQFSEVDTWV
jgi:hypothetical protein